jgi:hypothetical protein
MNGWENVGRIHTIPLDDIHEHSLCADCACGPTSEIVSESQVQQIVHNAFDGRDFDEHEEAQKEKIRKLNRRDHVPS